MTDANKRPSVAELLQEAQKVHVPQQVLELTATQAAGLFDEGVPAEVVDELERELEVGPDGWGVGVERRWRLEIVPGVRVIVDPGADPAGVLASLERIAQELRANPGLFDADWSKPLQRRPALRVVKGPGQK